MKAIILNGVEQPFECTDVALPVPSENEVLVEIKAAAMNHRDLWIQKGQYAGLRFPSIQGSDGSGMVVKTGSGVDPKWMNRNVVINPALNWGNNPHTQAKDFIILGMARDGTFAEYVTVDSALIYEMPDHLSYEQAAAFPLAGLTGFRALMTRAAAKPGEKVLVTGAGGGVALFCVQFSLALGCEVYVTSGDDTKITKAVALGAKGGVNYKSENWHKALLSMSGGFDVIIDSSGGDTFPKLVDSCKPGGRIAMYGSTLGAFNSGVPAKIFWKQLTICGSTMGSDAEFGQMIRFISDHKIVPVVDAVFGLADFQQAADRMAHGAQFGKIVIQVKA